jgi:hypothetical protein
MTTGDPFVPPRPAYPIPTRSGIGQAAPDLTGMRAVGITRFGGPEVLDVVELPDPVAGPGQQLYEVHAAGVDFADTHHRWTAQQTPR